MIGECLDVLPDMSCPSSKTRSRPLQCNSARYTSALKYQGESHHSLRSIDPAPNPTLRID